MRERDPPQGAPPREQVLFGLYGVTIVQGYLAKGRDRTLDGPVAALWVIAAAWGRARWDQ